MYTLRDRDIDRIAEEITGILNSERIPDQSREGIRLSAEELMLKYRERFGEDTKIELRHDKRFGKLHITLKLYCERFDPKGELSENYMLRNLMQFMDRVPSWAFRNGCNNICFSVKTESRLPSWAYILIACGLGVACGLAARLLPKETVLSLNENFLNPVSSAIMGFLSAMAGLLMALSITSGIIGMGNVATFSRVGKTLIGNILLWMLILAVVMIFVLGGIFPIGNSAETEFDFTSIWNMIIDIIPSSIIEPFNSGNTLQILFLSVIVSVIMLRSVTQLEPLVNIIQALNRVVEEVVILVIKTMPIVVFISIFGLASGSNEIELSSVYIYPLMLFVLCAGWLIFYTMRVCLKQRVRPGVLIKKYMPTFLIGFSTASSNAAFTTSLETCEKRYGIKPELVNAGIPLSHMINKPGAVIELSGGFMFMAQMFGVEISWSTLTSALLTAVMLAIAAPPIPGTQLAIVTLLYSVYGIPLEAVSVVAALLVITDRMTTALNITAAQLELIQVADKLGVLDRDVLRKEM